MTCAKTGGAPDLRTTGIPHLYEMVPGTRLELVRGLPTRPSNVRVCQFRHPGTNVIPYSYVASNRNYKASARCCQMNFWDKRKPGINM